MISSMLTPLRGVDEAGHLVANVRVSAEQAALSEYGRIPSGRCMHIVPAVADPFTVPTVELGCSGNNAIPGFIYRDSDSWSVGVPGPSSVTATGPSWSGGVDERLLMYVGLEGYELMTTEFDATRTYKQGDYLKSPTVAEAEAGAADDETDAVRNYAGRLTNDTVVYGIDTVVGIVSPGVSSPMERATGVDPHNNRVLCFYTTYRPPFAAVDGDIVQA
jgi:hypothetical protein